MTFTSSTIFKAVFAFLVSFFGAVGATAASHGGTLNNVDIGSWMLAVGSGLTAAGALLHTPDKAQSGPDRAISTVQDVVRSTVDAQQQLTKTAVDSVSAVISAVGALHGVLPSIPLPGFPGVSPPPSNAAQAAAAPPAGLPNLSNIPIIGGLLNAGEAALGPLASQVVAHVGRQ